MFGECHAPCMLKISFVNFEKEYVHCSHYKLLDKFFVPTQLSMLIQLSSNIVSPTRTSSFSSLPNSPYLFSAWSSNIAAPSLPSSFSSLPNFVYLFSCRRISLPHPFPHLFRPYPSLPIYSVVVEYRCPIPSLIFFVSTQLSILIQ